MDSNMRVEYRLNQIVTTVTKQSSIREHELSRYPLCILHGAFPELLAQMLTIELAPKIGNEDAVGIVPVARGEDIAKKLSDEIARFRLRMEHGDLRLLNQYYISVIFMADQLDADVLREDMAKLREQMKRSGFEGSSIGYYCIFNYETMDGASCRKQIEALLGDEECCYPMAVCTQNYLFATEYQKYLKVVQSVAMHIFLASSGTDETDVALRQGAERPLFVMGSWKFDVLKQKIADYLIHLIDREEEDLISGPDYIAGIGGIIDGIISFDVEYWLDLFCRIPVSYAKLKELMQPGLFGLRRASRSYRELFLLMYGREDAFAAFVRQNLGDGAGQEYVDRFFAAEIGNLYAVTNRLRPALVTIRERCEAELGQRKALGGNEEDLYRFERGGTVLDIISRMKSSFWEPQAQQLLCERKLAFVDALLARLDSAAWQEEIGHIRERNKSEINRLMLLRREVSMADERMSGIADLAISLTGDERIPKWKEDIFDDVIFDGLMGNLSAVRQQVQDWMEEHIGDVLGNFVGRLQALKRESQMEFYYSARLDNPHLSREREYLYTGLREQKARDEFEEAGQMVRLALPKARLLQRKWETDMCFELFVIREIGEPDEIYGIG